ncbi:DUF1439 domain-containing protein [Hydrogenophaga sp. T2]|uniref:DUF1439 domain-containing protein n=1 Tax=Hydrogenophaga sp. T2 TaxID=3132823 RepID=UPI003CE6A17B
MRRRHLFFALGALSGAPAAAHAADADADSGKPPGYAVSTAQLQQMVAQRFPLRYPVHGVLNLDVQAPRLQMLPEQNRLRAAMAVEVAGPLLSRVHPGRFDVDFALRYEASDRTVRAHQLRLARLNFPNMQPPAQELLNTYAPAVAERALQEVVLHQLQPSDLRAIDTMGMQPGPITVTKDGLVIGLVLKPL